MSTRRIQDRISTWIKSQRKKKKEKSVVDRIIYKLRLNVGEKKVSFICTYVRVKKEKIRSSQLQR
jgi:hypothetical protein